MTSRRTPLRRPLRAAILVAALLGLAPPAMAAAPPLPSLADREAFMASHRRLPPQLPGAPPRALAGQLDVDILSYELELFLDVAGERIEGTCAIRFEAAPGVPLATELVLDLYDNLAVTAVDRDGTPVDIATVTHAGNVLTIPLVPAQRDRDRPTTVTITYSGQPRELSFGTMTFTTQGTPPTPLIFTLSEPFFGRGWWPCKDVPDDKALVVTRVEAPDGLVVVSNGLQDPIQPGRPGHSITTWRENYPISTYLVAVSVTNYVTWSDTYTSLDGRTTMPVPYWAWPEHEAAAREDWSITPAALRFYAETFSEYPFLDEKYGQVAIPLWGAMEHQTATSYGAQIITGDHRYDFVVVHELAHQWWGDHVGPRTFESIWLNEGFASYSEALWWEHLGGMDPYLAYMRNLDILRSGNDFPGTVHQPDDYFNRTVYWKGAWTLHMLRWVLGQPASRPDAMALLPVLRAHGVEHAYDVASTDEFVATTSRVAARDMTWFFDQWVHRAGRPRYEVGWSVQPDLGGGRIVHLRVTQTQAGATYSMPVLVRLALPSGTQDVIVDNSLAMTDYRFPVLEIPASVTWDPDGWVLKQVVPVDVDLDDDGWPDWLDGCPAVPNPLQEDSDGDTIQDACQIGTDFDGDGVVNESDCAPADNRAWTEPSGPTLLLVRRDSAGVITLSFRNPDDSPQRAAVTDLAGGTLAILHSSRGPTDMQCVATGHAAPDYIDTTTMPPGGAWWLAWPWNGCGPADSGCR